MTKIPQFPVLNPTVLEVIKTHKPGGGYFWESGFDGVTTDLYYEGDLVAIADERGTYCSGITWQVYLEACHLWLRRHGQNSLKIDGLTSIGIKKMKSDWFVATGKRMGPVDALVSRGLGVRIENLHEASSGDFAQFWRENGSGHSVVILSVDADGITYWSTQSSTDGIGERTEYFMGKNAVKFDEVYIVRALAPIFRV